MGTATAHLLLWLGVLVGLPGEVLAQGGAGVQLARDGRSEHVIALRAGAVGADSLAARELSKYLQAVTGAELPIVGRGAARPAITLNVATRSPSGQALDAPDHYAISVVGNRITLTGASPRSLLYAAYDLIERAGVRFLAPDLKFYAGSHEYVPRTPTLALALQGEIVERPRFKTRKMDVSEGMSHDTASLRAMVEWMPKLRLNTLMLPQNFGGSGRVTWDMWRAALTPELERRGLDIEVGGHGYQNFLRADMPDPAAPGKTLFQTKPQWFGRDSSCAPARAERLAFNTSDSGAVRWVIDGVITYLKARPEIDIFDFWPPDGVRWSECAADTTLGTPEDRQAALVSRLHAAMRDAGLSTRLEMIAYANLKLPPKHVHVPGDVLVDFCPIGQNFDVAIDDTTGGNNRQYVEAIREWRRIHAGDLGLYAYYRRYAWRSLPMVMPRYIANDMRWWAGVPVQAVSTYFEPGDWGTYEVNHYAFGKLAWSDADIEALVHDYTAARYGADAGVAGDALQALEETVRIYGSIPYSKRRTAAEVDAARERIGRHAIAVMGASQRQRDVRHSGALHRLYNMLEFAHRDLDLTAARARGASDDELRPMVESLVGYLTAKADDGTYLMYGRNDRSRYMRHYGLSVATEP